ncbi:MAG: RNA methyltransferase [Verrucomicrobia bacterium]|nr:RNA methyltransferase [Verrucomicrobiota bacterium]
MNLSEQIAFLDPFVTEEKRAKMESVLALRTSFIRVVLEDVFQPHNASAVIRTCECFGVQNLHVIEKEHRYRPNADIARGATNWISLHRHKRTPGSEPPTLACLRKLRSMGYRIVATAPGDGSLSIRELDLSSPLALCFGTEWAGASDELLAEADIKAHIPMLGFTQSFNVSVSVALCLYELIGRLHRDRDDWSLSDAEKDELRLAWRKQTVRFSERILGAAQRRIES